MLVFLESLKCETFVNEHVTEEDELKQIVLTHFDLAQQVTYTFYGSSFHCIFCVVIHFGSQIFQHWKAFGESCLKAKKSFSLQNKDAYKFLEFNPSALSREEWKRRYEIVRADLAKMGIAVCAP